MLDPLLDPNIDADSLLRGSAHDNSVVGENAGTAPPRSVPMLELHHKQGHRHAIPYSHLLWIDFDPSIGIKLHFATHTVRIRGRNLHSVHEQLAAHSCAVLREVDASEDTGEMYATFITGLIFRPLRRGRDVSTVRSEKRSSTQEQKP